MSKKTPFIGRKAELEVLEKALLSTESEMVAIIGRRRVGKTFLIEHAYKQQLSFSFIGTQNAPKKEQLENFSLQLTEQSEASIPLKIPSSWMEAFYLLIAYLKTQIGEEKKVVFLDELPWIATPKSAFLRALGYFWNSWAVKNNIVLVICGSAASWMIQKVVNHKGGLHNRITRRIFLEPFSLKETEAYLQSRNIHFDRYHIAQLYMSLGGIPHYLKEIDGSLSATQNIDRICFAKTGLLREEFMRLYPSLFAHAEKHIAIIRALAGKWKGMTREELAKNTKLSNGGGLTTILSELEYSGFITILNPFANKKKERLFRLSDEYSLFYLHFMEHNKREGEGTWNHLSQTAAYKTWSGYAFENMCFRHLKAIKKSLDIAGIYSVSYSFYHKGTGEQAGAQIDLLIDRKDQTINLIECKFYSESFSLSKATIEKLRTRQAVFKSVTKTNKHLTWILITPFGLTNNQYSLGYIQKVLTLDDLFLV